MATCPECDAEIEVDEFDVDKGDLISCPDCGSNLEVTSITPVELEAVDEDDDEDEDDEIDPGKVGAHARQQLRGGFHRERVVPRTQQGAGESIPHERGVVGDDDGLVAHGLIAEFIRFLLISELLSIVIVRERVWPPARNVTPRSRSMNSTLIREI